MAHGRDYEIFCNIYIWEYLIGIFYGIPTSGIMGYLLVGTVSLQGILLVIFGAGHL